MVCLKVRITIFTFRRVSSRSFFIASNEPADIVKVTRMIYTYKLDRLQIILNDFTRINDAWKRDEKGETYEAV